MDKKPGKDDLADSLKKFEDFEHYKRQALQNVVEYIAKIDKKYQGINK